MVSVKDNIVYALNEHKDDLNGLIIYLDDKKYTDKIQLIINQYDELINDIKGDKLNEYC